MDAIPEDFLHHELFNLMFLSTDSEVKKIENNEIPSEDI